MFNHKFTKIVLLILTTVQCHQHWAPWHRHVCNSVMATHTCLPIHYIRSVAHTQHIRHGPVVHQLPHINNLHHTITVQMEVQVQVSQLSTIDQDQNLTPKIFLRCHYSWCKCPSTNRITRHFWSWFKLLATSSVIFIFRTSNAVTQ